MVGQAINMKQNIEARRILNQFGNIVWQLNDIWPTGGWGSLECVHVPHITLLQSIVVDLEWQ